MSDRFITLKCPQCGANLEIYDDMEHFTCGYCGAATVVQRRGGTVALKAVTEAIKKVQVGTDKTAAELAIIRLQGELDGLYRHRERLGEDKFLRSIAVFVLDFLFCFVLAAILIGGFEGAWYGRLLCFVLLPSGIFLIHRLLRPYKRVAVEKLLANTEKIDLINKHIQKQKRIVNGQ